MAKSRPRAPFSQIYAKLGNLIRAYRKNAGLSQEELAERVGLSRTSITNIEKGRQRIAFDLVFSFADALAIGDPRKLIPETAVAASPDFEDRIPKNFDEAERRAVRRLISDARSSTAR